MLQFREIYEDWHINYIRYNKVNETGSVAETGRGNGQFSYIDDEPVGANLLCSALLWSDLLTVSAMDQSIRRFHVTTHPRNFFDSE